MLLGSEALEQWDSGIAKLQDNGAVRHSQHVGTLSNRITGLRQLEDETGDNGQ